MTDLDLDALEKVAREATPGVWWHVGSEIMCNHDPVVQSQRDTEDYYDEAAASDEDMAHIAAFDPPTVLALIARVREAEAESKLARAELRAYAALEGES